MEPDDDDDPGEDDEQSDPPEFPLSPNDLAELRELAVKVRRELRTAHPSLIRRAAVALIALERLPKMTPGVAITVGWRTPSSGTWEWADVFISEEEVRASVGAHFYDPGVGGDTESEVLFSAYAGGSRQGSLGGWTERAQSVAASGYLALTHEWGGEDHIDWLDYEDEDLG